MNSISFVRRFSKMNKINDLAEYYNLPNTENNKNKIFFYQHNDKIYYIIYFYRKLGIKKSELIRNNFIGLPMELNEIIADFIVEEFEVTILLEKSIHSHYPYKRNIFRYVSHEKNFNSELDLDEYYRDICEINNEMEFLPAICLIKEFLMLFVQLNTFDYLLEK